MDRHTSNQGDRYFDLPLERLDAVVMDLDGVITDTALLHQSAWKELFDKEFARRGLERRFTREDYLRYVDGKSRRDGVKSFLAVAGIELPEGTPNDSGSTESVWGVAKRKDEYFLAELAKTGPRPYPGTVNLLKGLRQKGMPIGVVSGSRNCRLVLDTAGLSDLFDARVDGEESLRMGLPGKPDPATFLEAARRLGSPPSRTMVVEDAIAGIRAGNKGGFGLVIGVDRVGQRDALLEAGADVVVSDLSFLRIPPIHRTIHITHDGNAHAR
ncbi:MAG: beta-phosphoglucomutase family hydrolase [Actinobacteria bacterium]|nr:beta-phosphoglucomutase family hydrolase [Actinomycetota bacterium]MCL5447371.1 beta-phosphoglucomutase family hydrolase [Actinomycetota bacterium]